MELIQAKIILKKRKECDARLARKGGCAGRCSICPLWTTLDDYIAARLVISNHTVYRDTDALYYTEADTSKYYSGGFTSNERRRHADTKGSD